MMLHVGLLALWRFILLLLKMLNTLYKYLMNINVHERKIDSISRSYMR